MQYLSRVIAKAIYALSDVEFGLFDGTARIGRFAMRHFFDVVGENVGRATEYLGAFQDRCLRPVSLLGGVAGSDGFVEFVDGGGVVVRVRCGVGGIDESEC